MFCRGLNTGFVPSLMCLFSQPHWSCYSQRQRQGPWIVSLITFVCHENCYRKNYQSIFSGEVSSFKRAVFSHTERGQKSARQIFRLKKEFSVHISARPRVGLKPTVSVGLKPQLKIGTSAHLPTEEIQMMIYYISRLLIKVMKQQFSILESLQSKQDMSPRRNAKYVVGTDVAQAKYS